MNRVALVTGGSKGIGLGIAKALARRQIELVLVARTYADLQTARESILAEHPKLTVHALTGDVTNAHDVQAILDFVREQYGKLDILVNNAGVYAEYGTTAEGAVHAAQAVFAVNAGAPAVFSSLFQPLLLEGEHPLQLDVLSTAAVTIAQGGNPYEASKVAHERISLSTVIDSCGRICTYRIYPSYVATNMNADYEALKLDATFVGEEAVRMMLYDEATDLCLKQGEGTVLRAQFTIDYTKYIRETEKGDLAIDGYGLVADHRALVRVHFEPILRGVAEY